MKLAASAAEQARERAPAVGAPPHQAAEHADADERRKRLGQEKRVEHALDEEDRIHDAQHRDREPADASDPEIMPILSVAHQDPPVSPSVNSAPASTRKAEHVDMFAARTDAISRPDRAGKQQTPAGESEGVLGIRQEHSIGAALRDHRGHNQADQRPTHRADALHEVAEQHADATRSLGRGRSRRSRASAAAP